MTPWERYDGQHTEAPRIAVYSNGDGRINAPADRRWFADVDAVTAYVDRVEHQLALVAGDDGPRPLTLSREHDAGGDIAITGAIKRAGVDPVTIDETQYLPLEEETIFDGTTAVVADLSPLVDGDRDGSIDEDVESPQETEGSDSADAAAADDEATGAFDAVGDLDLDADDPTAALETFLLAATAGGERYECESREIAEHVPLSSRQVGHHMGTLREECAELQIAYERANDHADWDRARWVFEHADVDDSDATAEPETERSEQVGRVRRAAERVDTVQELADALDVRPGQARSQAQAADVYSELVDEVQRPGVSR